MSERWYVLPGRRGRPGERREDGEPLLLLASPQRQRQRQPAQLGETTEMDPSIEG